VIKRRELLKHAHRIGALNTVTASLGRIRRVRAAAAARIIVGAESRNSRR
jgi:hypothetical protein